MAKHLPPPAPKGNQYAKGHGFGRPAEYTIEILEEMAKDLMEWAHTDDAIVFREWLALRGIIPSTLVDLKRRSAVFARAIECAKYLIGTRREKMAMKGEIGDSIVRTSLGIYDDEMKDWILEQKKNDAAAPAVINIHGTRGSMKKNVKVE